MVWCQDLRLPLERLIKPGSAEDNIYLLPFVLVPILQMEVSLYLWDSQGRREVLLDEDLASFVRRILLVLASYQCVGEQHGKVFLQ